VHNSKQPSLTLRENRINAPRDSIRSSQQLEYAWLRESRSTAPRSLKPESPFIATPRAIQIYL
jgi:hypothetical protein